MTAACRHPYDQGRLASCRGASLRPGGERLTRRLIELAGLPRGARVLDLCCGQGDGTALLSAAGCHALGLDADREALVLARRHHPDPDWLLADASCVPLTAASMDGVLAECCLSLQRDRAGVLGECRRLLPRGAPLAVTDVCRRAALPEAAAALPDCMARMPTPDGLRQEIEQAGFVVERMEDHSDVLKAFVAKLVFSTGSLNALWSPADGTSADAGVETLRQVRPGYFLFLARAG